MDAMLHRLNVFVIANILFLVFNTEQDFCKK